MENLNIFRRECAQLVRVAAFSLHSINAYRNTGLCTYRRALHVAPAPPGKTVNSRLIRAPPAAAAATFSTTGKFKERLKREDVRRVRPHDSAFSEWKILIEGWDGKDDQYSLVKKRAELPNFNSCAGAYEIGLVSIATSWKIDPDCVTPAYIGHSKNIKNRLQQYRCNGAHLENGARFFSKALSKGWTIVYRESPTKSKKDAEIFEKDLLVKYDYGFNKRSNGERRPDEIFQNLERETRFCFPSHVMLMLTCFQQKQVVDKTENSTGIFSRIASIRMCESGRVESAGFRDNESKRICGVAIGDGSICSARPVEGRKRCSGHKGMKVKDIVSKCDEEGKARLRAAASTKERLKRRRVACKACGSFERRSDESFSSYLWSSFRKWFSALR